MRTGLLGGRLGLSIGYPRRPGHYHERALRELRAGAGEVEVEVRPLERYDQLTPA